MSTLTSAPLAPLIDKLFKEAEALSPETRSAIGNFTEAEQWRVMQDKSSYLDFYSKLKDCPLPISRQTGTLLYMMARSIEAKSIVEFGTSFGISTIHLAAALRDNGGGRLITSEFEPSRVVKARQNLTEAGLIDLVEIREGDALETLKVDLPEAIDLVLLDGHKALYPEILALLQSHLRPGALIIADNADFSPEYLDIVRTTSNGYMSTPFDEEVELSIRLI